MAKVVTFGELMIRLQPYNYERFIQADHLEFSFGGGEANVAVSLANYGLDAAYVTKLPAHAIGQAAVNSLRRYGVDTSMIVRGGDRVGIYFNEKGASQRGSVCIYDRAHSAIQEASTADFDWDKIFNGVDWFHFTGITPALGPNVVDICREACKAAKAHGVKISCDLNYRGKLWSREQARAAMTDLCQYVDVCISNEEDAKDVFGIEAEATDIYGGSLRSTTRATSPWPSSWRTSSASRRWPSPCASPTPPPTTAGAPCCMTPPPTSTASPRSMSCASSTAWAAATASAAV